MEAAGEMTVAHRPDGKALQLRARRSLLAKAVCGEPTFLDQLAPVAVRLLNDDVHAAMVGGTKATWSGHAGGHLSDDEAQAGAVSIEDRRGEFRRPDSRAVPQERAENTVQRLNPLGLGVNRAHGPTLFARARVQRPPDRVASLARRRHLAASGPLPPSLVARFTTGEAVLRTVADEVRDKGRCDRTYAELAARAGVGRTTARNAVRRAGELGFLQIEERPGPGRKHLANVVRITSREWQAWIHRRGRRDRTCRRRGRRRLSRPALSD
jgi:hypothetical protein